MREFKLKFLHLTGKVTVDAHKEDGGYWAKILFPQAYLQKFGAYQHHCQIWARDENYACEVAAFEFKQMFKALDNPIHGINPNTFYLTKGVFKKIKTKIVGGVEFDFIYADEFYAIGEIIDGDMYFKCTFIQRERVDTKRVIFWMNSQAVFQPLRVYGFNNKFMERLLHKYDTVKINELSQYTTSVYKDLTVEIPADRRDKHVAKHREMFNILIHTNPPKKSGEL